MGFFETHDVAGRGLANAGRDATIVNQMAVQLPIGCKPREEILHGR